MYVGSADPLDAYLSAIGGLSPDYFYCADVGVTVTGSGASNWDDQSGANHDGTQTIDAKRPPLIANEPTLNNRAALDFLGVQSLLASGGSGWPAGANHTLVCVLNQGVSANIEFLMDIQSGRLAWSNQAPSYLVGASEGTWRTTGANATGAQTVEWHAVVGAQLQCFRNGSSLGATSWPNTRTIGGTVVIGANYLHSGNWLKGKLATVIGWASSLSAGQITTMRGAIRDYYGSGVMP